MSPTSALGQPAGRREAQSVPFVEEATKQDAEPTPTPPPSLPPSILSLSPDFTSVHPAHSLLP